MTGGEGSQVGELLAVLRSRQVSLHQKEVAALNLAALTRESYAAAGEVRERGGIAAMLRLLSEDHEGLVAAAAEVIANCSGDCASKGRARAYFFGGGGGGGDVTVRIQEAGYADGGLGWRVWAGALILARHLLAGRDLLPGQGGAVLELGAGCGLCGLLCSSLCAAEVTITDYTEGLLNNLRVSAELHLEGRAGGGQWGTQGGGAWAWGPARAAPTQSPPPSKLQLSLFDWEDDLAEEEGRGGQGTTSGADEGSRGGGEALPPPPRLPSRCTFDCVVGSDLLYDWAQCRPLAAAISARLGVGAAALLVLPIRIPLLWDAFLGELRCRRVAAWHAPCDLTPEDFRVAGDGSAEASTMRGAGQHEGGIRTVVCWREGQPRGGESWVNAILSGT